RLVVAARRTLSMLIGTLGAALMRVLGPLAIPIMLPLHLTFAALLVLGQRGGQRAEYLADQIAAEVAGSAAVAAMLAFLLTSDALVATLKAAGGRVARPE